MKTKLIIKTFAFTSLAALSTLSAQGAVLSGPGILDFNHKARQPGSNALAVVNIADLTPHQEVFTSGTTTWTHSLSGFSQVRTSLGIATLVDVQLAPYTQMDGNSLSFGREITTEVLVAGSSLTDPLNTLAGSSVLQSWNSTAAVAADITAGQTYRISFDVDTLSGIPVDLFSTSTAQFTGNGLQNSAGGLLSAIDLLGLITVGGASTDTITFETVATQDLTSVGFNFAASAVADVSALGGTAANQNLISFSNFTVTPVPEPSAAFLSLAASLLLVSKRRR
ncbi:hypothetical protein [Roseibacillus persicicus]|uniref:PEP-CTERM protein-sorting domain-containing protein n=1 Tax=Roseibacillus persicicus TaxID=454148 RepID=A0A918TWA2_9BACT|nr:hypothetical protein [Roseibacillus persicicus]GHC65916.1 hypothetical protein GCM10007100_37120 [Roseibacillus persicicus]